MRLSGAVLDISVAPGGDLEFLLCDGFVESQSWLRSDRAWFSPGALDMQWT